MVTELSTELEIVSCHGVDYPPITPVTTRVNNEVWLKKSSYILCGGTTQVMVGHDTFN